MCQVPQLKSPRALELPTEGAAGRCHAAAGPAAGLARKIVTFNSVRVSSGSNPAHPFNLEVKAHHCNRGAWKSENDGACKQVSPSLVVVDFAQ